MDIINLLISLVSGLIGGNATGAVAKDTSLGVVGNSIAGLVGGGLGTYIAQATDMLTKVQGSNLDITSLLGTIGSGGIGGIILTVIAGFIKKAMQKQ
jgi:uncharacterized membrane protein YeaQ/YmgE (transglycosylase-associated protein family)